MYLKDGKLYTYVIIYMTTWLNALWSVGQIRSLPEWLGLLRVNCILLLLLTPNVIRIQMDVKDKTKFDIYKGPFDSQLCSVVVIKNMPHNHACLGHTEIWRFIIQRCLIACQPVAMYIVNSYQIVYFTAFFSYILLSSPNSILQHIEPLCTLFQ